MKSTALFVAVLLLARAALGQGSDLLAFSARFYAPGRGEITHQHLYTIRPDGTGRRQLTSGKADDTEPKWLPNGSGLVFLRSYQDNSKPDSIRLVNVKTGSVRTLYVASLKDAKTGASVSATLIGLRLSPDGKWVLARQNYPVGNDYAASLWAAPVSGKSPSRLLKGGAGIKVTSAEWAGSETIFARCSLPISQENGEAAILLTHFTSGENNVPVETQLADVGDTALSPGGKWLLAINDQEGKRTVAVRAVPSGKPIAVWQTPQGIVRWQNGYSVYVLTYQGGADNPTGPGTLFLYQADGKLLRKTPLTRDSSALAAQFRQGRELNNLTRITSLPRDQDRFLWGAFEHRYLPGLQLIVDTRTGKISFWSNARYADFSPSGRYFATTSNLNWASIGKKADGSPLTQNVVRLLIARANKPDALTPLTSGNVWVEGFDWRP